MMTRISNLIRYHSVRLPWIWPGFLISTSALSAQAIIEIPISNASEVTRNVYVVILMEEPALLKAHLGAYRALGYFRISAANSKEISVAFANSARESNKHYVELNFLSGINERGYKFNFSNHGADNKLPLKLEVRNFEIKAIFTQGTKMKFPGESNPHSRHFIIAASESIKSLSEKYSISNASFDWSSPSDIW